VPTTASGNEGFGIDGREATTMEHCEEPTEPVGSVARTVKAKVPLCPGVPENSPFVEFSRTPMGSPPAPIVQVYGVAPPTAVAEEEYGLLTLATEDGHAVTVTAVKMWSGKARSAVLFCESVTRTLTV